MHVKPATRCQAQSLGSVNTHSFSSLGDRWASLDLENGSEGGSRQGKAGLEHSLCHPGHLPTPNSVSLPRRHVTERQDWTGPLRPDPISSNL